MSNRAVTIVLSLCIVVALIGGCTCGSVGTGVVAWGVAKGGWTWSGPAPVPGNSLMVLVVEEGDDRAKLPESQQHIFTSAAVREYLKSRNTKLRVLDEENTDVSKDEAWVAIAMARKRSAVPWILISNGRKGHEGPLPKSVDELLALLKRY